MYLARVSIENFRCFGAGEDCLNLQLGRGLSALVGENDAGKSAIVDALRAALGTTDQEYYRLEDDDFHAGARDIRVVCAFEGLTDVEQRAFVEYLTYPQDGVGELELYLNWTASDSGELAGGRPYRRVEVRSGRAGDGPVVAPEARELLRATYLRPLRDAGQAMASGRGSRLSQVLAQTEKILASGSGYNPDAPVDEDLLSSLNVLGIGDLANALLAKQGGVRETRKSIDGHLAELTLRSDAVASNIEVSGAGDSDKVRLRRMLEKLDLRSTVEGKPGLGTDNLLFMACELLLLAGTGAGARLLLIEEPEAHLHPQRQLRVMQFLQSQAVKQGVQIVATTHSPILASVVSLDNLVMVRNGRAFPMGRGETALERSDYAFLERFLDATKANLFFARGVVIVEGDAETILLPTLARLLNRDFGENGVSVVNVGGVGLRRYSRIFQRKATQPPPGTAPTPPDIGVPVACVTDMDVMPDCAPFEIGKLERSDPWPAKSKTRRWRAKKDFPDGLDEERKRKLDATATPSVRTFVADEWTFEYDLALGPKSEDGTFAGGIGEHVYVAACLALEDEGIHRGADASAVSDQAAQEYQDMLAAAAGADGCTEEEVLASRVYAKFARDGASKAVAAQYLASRLAEHAATGTLSAAALRLLLPHYIVSAIDHVTVPPPAPPSGTLGANPDA